MTVPSDQTPPAPEVSKTICPKCDAEIEAASERCKCGFPVAYFNALEDIEAVREKRARAKAEKEAKEKAAAAPEPKPKKAAGAFSILPGGPF